MYVDVAADWFLSGVELREAAPRRPGELDARSAWTSGNSVRPLVHGVTYFRQLLRVANALGPGDLLLFTDWRGDPDQRLDGPGTDIGKVFAAAARRGAEVRGLIWRSHSTSSGSPPRRTDIWAPRSRRPAARCLLDMRVRRGGLAPPEDGRRTAPRTGPSRDVAFVGGIDLCHGRRDDATAPGRPAAATDAAVDGTPPWHDVQLELGGPRSATSGINVPRALERPDPTRRRNPVHLHADTTRADRSERPRPSHELTRHRSREHRAGAAHVSSATPAVSVRAAGRAQRRPRVQEGLPAGTAAGVHRGPVPLVDRVHRVRRALRS